ncbi:MAG: iron-containing redox enzyme family protein [Burkholderiales bacterium]|nr:iron-containing redox enzyme family protein [Burkholderiales bacterium]
MSFFDDLVRDTAAARLALLQVPILQDALAGRVARHQYTAFLIQAYHHVRHTAPLLTACGERLPEHMDWLRAAVAHYVEEETGHDEWILSDLAACGVDPDVVRRSAPAFATELMVAYAWHQIERCNPVGFFGMVHVLEGTSVAIATAAAQAIQRALGLPAQAFTYLTSHGSLDVEHTRLFEVLMNRLDHDEDRRAVVRCAHAFYQLYGDMFRALPREDRRTA